MAAARRALVIALALAALLSASAQADVDLSNVGEVCLDELANMAEACAEEIDALQKAGEDATPEQIRALPPASATCCSALRSYNDNLCGCDEGVIELAGDFLSSDAGRNLGTLVQEQCGFAIVEGDACP
mmetsp:Transcript_29744/g.95647  ORF Transcript_29744/g.95647 Transcript_29744/m.95647 type:complete len:129 (+) Transcript_29744:290-676(+)